MGFQLGHESRFEAALHSHLLKHQLPGAGQNFSLPLVVFALKTANGITCQRDACLLNFLLLDSHLSGGVAARPRRQITVRQGLFTGTE